MTRRAGPLGFGIVGCGGAAADVARGLDAAAGVALRAVHDRDPARADAIAGPRAATVHPTLAALLDDPRVEVVYVALPHDLLASTAIAALRASRHVLLEKPGAVSRREMAALRRAAGRSDRRVAILFELREVPTVAIAVRLVRAGLLGRLRTIRILTRIDKPAGYWSSGPSGALADPWRASLARAGGGVVLMNSIHQIDLVRAITGLEPVRVAALTSAGVAGVEVEDAAVAAVAWSGGVLGGLVAAAHAAGAVDDETIEIDGDDGSLRLGDPYVARPRIDWFVRPAAGAPETRRWRTSRPRPADPFRGAIAAFATAIREDREPVPGLADADVALATVDAIYRSARTGRFEPVRPTGAPASTTAGDAGHERPAGRTPGRHGDRPQTTGPGPRR